MQVSLFQHWFCHRRVQARCLPLVRARICGRSGLEVGGPSSVFRGRRGLLPLYPLVGHLDNCNFAGSTVWEGKISEGATFRYARFRRPGQQYVAEASNLSMIASSSYDFVLSSHMLEHSANALGALRELLRVLRDDGTLVLLLPHREGTFGHRRPVTTLAHLIEDERAGMGEDDLTHLAETLALHDFSRDPGAGTAEEFRARSLRNAENRCLHHHVFDTQLAVVMLNHAGVQLLAVETALPFHIVAIASKLTPGKTPDNAAFLAGDSSWRAVSVFASDHIGG